MSVGTGLLKASCHLIIMITEKIIISDHIEHNGNTTRTIVKIAGNRINNNNNNKQSKVIMNHSLVNTVINSYPRMHSKALNTVVPME